MLVNNADRIVEADAVGTSAEDLLADAGRRTISVPVCLRKDRSAAQQGIGNAM